MRFSLWMGAVAVFAAGPARAAGLDSGDTAWMLTATALVLLMTLPGLAFFYAGLVRRKNILATMTQVFLCAAVVSLTWFLLGWSIAFTPGDAWLPTFTQLGPPPWLGPHGLAQPHPLAPTIPAAVFLLYQGTFAIITTALIVGAVAERMKLSSLMLFCALWSLLVYAPVARWVWGETGFFRALGVLDFAGGSVVHISAGAAGLACVLIVGPRHGWGREPMVPANLAYMLIGAGLLWVGWLGFNGGSAGAANAQAGLAVVNTQLGAGVAVLAYALLERIVRGQNSLVGMATGAVGGLVAITPAAGFVEPLHALVFGVVGGGGAYLGVTVIKAALNRDDSLDVFGIHGVVGVMGCVLTPLLASPQLAGHAGSLSAELACAAAVFTYSFLVSLLLMLALKATVGVRVSLDDEADGLDLSQQGEQLE